MTRQEFIEIISRDLTLYFSHVVLDSKQSLTDARYTLANTPRNVEIHRPVFVQWLYIAQCFPVLPCVCNVSDNTVHTRYIVLLKFLEDYLINFKYSLLHDGRSLDAKTGQREFI